MIHFKKIKIILNESRALFLWVLLIGFFLIGIKLRWEALDIVRLNEWLSRDIDRALNLFSGTYFPLAGPETTNGLRLPGPFLYILMAIPFFFETSYESLFNFYFVINSASLFVSFYVVRKYFNFNTAFLVTVLQSTHLLYIEAIAFPINPTFLLPLIPFLLWAILEFSLNRNEKALKFVGLIISLGIQIHLSIATFLLVPLVWSIIFRIKISTREILRTALVSLATFLPFIYYFFNSYKPDLPISHVTKFDPFSNFFEPIKILTVQNTVNRLTDFNIGQGNLTNFSEVSKLFTLTQFTLLNISLLGIVIFGIFKIKKEGIESYQKEILVFLFFYCPALIYDLIRPWDIHFWYNYIFIFPTALLVSKFITTVLEVLKKTISINLIAKIISLSLLGYWTFYNISYIRDSKKTIGDMAYIGDYQNYNGFKLLSNKLAEALGISLNTFFSNVFDQKMFLLSTENPKLLNNNKKLNKETLIKENCFFIIDDRFFPVAEKYASFIISEVSDSKLKKEREKLDIFLKDPTLKISPSYMVSFKGDDLPGFHRISRVNRKYHVYEYRPKNKQNCYSNQINPFPVTLEDNSFYDDLFNFQKSNNKLLKNKFEFDSAGVLDNLEIKYILLEGEITNPVIFQVEIRKKPTGYDVKTQINSYFWGVSKSDKFIFTELKLNIYNDGKLKIDLPIISENSWVANGYGINTVKPSWYRNFEIKNGLKVMKAEMLFEISGKLMFPSKDKSKEVDFKTFIPIL